LLLVTVIVRPLLRCNLDDVAVVVIDVVLFLFAATLSPFEGLTQILVQVPGEVNRPEQTKQRERVINAKNKNGSF